MSKNIFQINFFLGNSSLKTEKFAKIYYYDVRRKKLKAQILSKFYHFIICMVSKRNIYCHLRGFQFQYSMWFPNVIFYYLQGFIKQCKSSARFPNIISYFWVVSKCNFLLSSWYLKAQYLIIWKVSKRRIPPLSLVVMCKPVYLVYAAD